MTQFTSAGGGKNETQTFQSSTKILFIRPTGSAGGEPINYYPFIEKSSHREIALFTRDQYSRPDEIRLLYQKMKEHFPKFS